MSTFGIYLASRFSPGQQLNLLIQAMWICIIGSFAVALAMPSVGLYSTSPVSWSGLFSGGKNLLGMIMLLSSFAFLSLFLGQSQQERSTFRQANFYYPLAGIFLSFCLVLLSTSKTSLVVSFCVILVLLFYRKFKWHGKSTVLVLDITILLTGISVAFLMSNWVSLLTALGRDATLTGRVPLWNFMLTTLLKENPILGLGHSAFFDDYGKYMPKVRSVVGWGMAHGHNGYLDLMLSVGIVGLILFLISFFRAYFLALRQAYASKSAERLWALSFLTILAIANITENYLLYNANVYWVLYTSIALSVGQSRNSVKLSDTSSIV
jgi:O-antigen ligase